MAKSSPKKTSKKTKSISENKSLFKNLQDKIKTSKKELLAQVDELSNEVKAFKNNNQAKKVIKKLEKKYQKQVSEMQKEFHERIDSLQEMQAKLLDHLPKDILEKISNTTPTKTVKPKTTGSAAKKTTPKSPLASIKGVGPATIKKLEAAGITSLEDIAKPTPEKAEALKGFEKTKGYSTWQAQAKELIS